MSIHIIYADNEFTSLFDRIIAKQMLVINSNSKGTVNGERFGATSVCNLFCLGLAVLRKHFRKLCHCLPEDYKETILRIKRTSIVQDGLMGELAMLPTPELVNCHILAAMIRPLTEEVHLVAICVSLKDLVDSLESKTFIENLKNGKSIFQALSVSAFEDLHG